MRLFRKEPVLAISLLCAVASCVAVPPDAGYAGYVDLRTITLLFCLMATIRTLVKAGLSDALAAKVTAFQGSSRRLALLLVIVVFLASAFMTNDVALIAFVPFTLLAVSDAPPDDRIALVVLETIAANLGSMVLPSGNPQNLYLYGHFRLTTASFLRVFLPLWLASLALLLACTACRRWGARDVRPVRATAVPDRKRLVTGLFLFALCLLTVLRVFDWRATLLVVVLSLLFLDPSVFREVDYALLGTFCAFFVFSGNMARLESLTAFLTSHLAGREVGFGILASQVVSNVPAAILLSRFTSDGLALAVGADLGGLGTLVASLASLISFKAYAKDGGDKRRYLLVFTGYNLLFLAVLVPVSLLLVR